MTRLICLIGVIWAMSVAVPAIGEVLTVGNASFEQTILSPGEATLNGVGLDHWIPKPGEGVGLWNVSNLVDFPGGAPNGNNVAYSAGPSISQVLSDVVVEGKTYTLRVNVGNSPCCDFPGYGVQLLADGVVLAEDANYISVPSGAFETVVVNYTSPPGDLSAGHPLEIRLLSLGLEVTFDAVSLSATTDAFPEWKLVHTDGAVSRGGASMAYDSARAAVVMFGGWGAGPLADTWEFDDNSWSLVTTANSPPARVWYSVVYDSRRQRIVLFGGIDPATNTYFNDTWEYDGTNWQQIITLNSPPMMQVRTMAFDSGRNRTVLFGGEGGGPSYNDTWEYDGSDWAQIVTPASPPKPGPLAAMAYDAARQQTVLTFGDSTLHLATWEYDGSTWTEINTSVSPLRRWAHTMVYDTSSHHLVLFGGTSPDHALPMNDTWEYDGSDWTQIVTPHWPGPADQHAMAFDTTNGRAVVLLWDGTWTYTSPEIFSSSFEGEDSPENHAPVIISAPVTGGQVGAPYYYDVDATDTDNDLLHYELTLSPGGMLIDEFSGEINWTPTAPGIVPVQVQVSDGNGGTDLQDWNINVVPVVPNSDYEIVFLTDQSILFTEIGQTAVISAVVIDSEGQTVPTELTWELEPTALVSLVDSNATSAQVRADSLAIETVLLTVSSVDLGISNTAQIALAELTDDAVFISSDLVIVNDHVGMTVILARTADTEVIPVGGYLLSGDKAGVLVRVLSVTLTADQVILTVEAAKITDVLKNAHIWFSSPPESFQVVYSGVQKSLKLSRNFEVIAAGVPTGGLECKLENGSNFGLDITGGSITWDFTSSLAMDLMIDNSVVQEFYLTTTQALDLTATTGSLEFLTILAGKVICKLDLPSIVTPAYPISVFSFNLALNPSVGVEVTGSIDGPSFKIVGPTGTLGGSATAGIRYTDASGWEPVAGVGWSGSASPMSAEFDPSIEFDLDATAYGGLGLGFDANLGYPPFSITLASLEFAEVKENGDIHALLKGRTGTSMPCYTENGDIHALLKGKQRRGEQGHPCLATQKMRHALPGLSRFAENI